MVGVHERTVTERCRESEGAFRASLSERRGIQGAGARDKVDEFIWVRHGQHLEIIATGSLCAVHGASVKIDTEMCIPRSQKARRTSARRVPRSHEALSMALLHKRVARSYS